MRRTTIGWQLLSALTLAAPALPVAAQERSASIVAERWTDEELDNLLAPIALYPDPILAQVLVAATYPDEVLAARAHVKAFGAADIDQMPWAPSVKAVAHYGPVLNLLADGEDWMTALGQSYATQPNDVMDAVQRLRRMANAQGNLQTTAQQQVVVEREVIRIVPAEPRVIYVPTYDPAVIYHRPVYIAHAHPAYWSWGVGFPIGVWLSYDLDWHTHRVYHHGWHAHGPRWVVVSRPWIVINPIYVARRNTIVVVNRGVVHRRWDTQGVRRYAVVHRGATFDRHDRGYRRAGTGWERDGRRVSDRLAVPRNEGTGMGKPTPKPDYRPADVPREHVPREHVTRGSAPRSAPPMASRRDNGTWNARPERERAVPAPSAPRTETPRASVPRPPRSGSATPAPRRERSSSSAPRGGAKRESRGEPRGDSRAKPRGN